MKGWPSALVAGWIVGCSGGDDEAPPPPPPEQGVVLGLRTPDGQPALDVEGNLGGGNRADPDASGFVYYVDVSPGRIQVSVSGDGYAIGHGAPDVRPGTLALATVVPLPLETETVEDPSQPHTVEGDGFTVEIPGGVVQFDDLPAVGPWTVGKHRITEADRYSIPGDELGLVNDGDIRAIVIEEVIALRGWNELSDSFFPAEAKSRFTVDLPADSPLLAPNAKVGAYIYSGSRTFWTYAGTPEIDPDAKTATWEGTILGWWALAREVPEPTDRSCVAGRVLDGLGGPLQGAEIRLYQEGVLGVDRISTDDGAFCLPIDVGASAEVRLVGVSPNRSALYTWSGTVTGGASPGACGSAACVDLGTITVESWGDVDADRSWAGPGGDCDDENPGVNPNPTLGDGTYCGDRL